MIYRFEVSSGLFKAKAWGHHPKLRRVSNKKSCICISISILVYVYTHTCRDLETM